MFPPQRPTAAACPLSHTTRVHCIEVEVQTGVQMFPIEICQKNGGKPNLKTLTEASQTQAIIECLT